MPDNDQKKPAAILGVGKYLPEKILTNADLEKMVDTSNEWIVTRTGIRERHIATENDSSATMATEASKLAIADAGLTPEDIDMIIVATSTPEMIFPSTACFVQNALGIHDKHVPAFDLAAACSGFCYATIVAAQFVQTGFYKNILVSGAETLSRVTDYTDRNTCVLFGDGAGAVVVGESRGRHEIVDGFMAADGSTGELLNLPGGGSLHPTSHETVDKGMHYIKIEGREVYKFAVNSMAGMVNDTMAKHNLEPDDIGVIVAHQANYRIIEAVSRRTRITMDKMYLNLDKYGNTSAASIPIALREAIDDGKVPEGKYAIFCAFGGGFTWTSILLKW